MATTPLEAKRLGFAEGIGLTQSVRGRLAEVGGRAEVDSQPGAGTEVRLWLT